LDHDPDKTGGNTCMKHMGLRSPLLNSETCRQKARKVHESA